MALLPDLHHPLSFSMLWGVNPPHLTRQEPLASWGLPQGGQCYTPVLHPNGWLQRKHASLSVAAVIDLSLEALAAQHQVRYAIAL